MRNHSHQTQKEFYLGQRDLREHLERRAQQANLVEKLAERKFFSTEYNMEIQNSERRNSEYALFESQRELESQRQPLLMANHWADQAQRERIHLCSELEMRSHLHQEGYARSYQEIDELKRRCCQEENAARQQKSEELNAQQNQDSLGDQVRRLQERLEFIEDLRIIQDPDSPSSYGSTHISHQAHITSSSRKPSREPRTPRITRADMSISGDALDCQAARGDPDEIRMNSKNLAKSAGSFWREGIEKSGSEEPLQSIPSTLFSGESKYIWSGRARLSHVYDKPCCGFWDLYSKWHDDSELSSSEINLGKLTDHTEFQSWIVNFRTEVCSKTNNPTIALQWIKEVEVAKSQDGKHYPDFSELDLVVAGALKRCYDKHTHVRKKISVEEQRAQKRQPISQKETNCLFGLRILSSH